MSSRQTLLFLYIAAFYGLAGAGLSLTFVPNQMFADLPERRKLADAPILWPRVASLDPALSTDVNKWFDDHYGFRSPFIRLKNEFDYRVFSLNALVHIGKEGYMFLKYTSSALQRFDNKTSAELDPYKAKIQEVAAKLLERNIQLVVVLFPSKNDIMRDKAPTGVYFTRPGGACEQLRHFLNRQSGIIFVDAHGSMLGTPSGDREAPFYRTDLHPNFFGSMPIAREIVERLHDREGHPPPSWREFPLRRIKWTGGTDSLYLGLLRPLPETIWSPVDTLLFTDTEHGTWKKDAYFKEVIVIRSTGAPFDFSYHTREENRVNRLPSAIIYGNSFSDSFFAVGMHEYFDELYRARALTGRLDLILKNIPQGVKYFIWQLSDAYLNEIIEGT